MNPILAQLVANPMVKDAAFVVGAGLLEAGVSYAKSLPKTEPKINMKGNVLYDQLVTHIAKAMIKIERSKNV